MQPITILTLGLFFAVVIWRIRNRVRSGKLGSSGTPRLKLIKILVGALAAWIAIGYSFQHSIAKMDGNDREPSWFERLVTFVAK